MHLLLTPDNIHNNVVKDVPIIGFRKAKSLKDILVRENLKLKTKVVAVLLKYLQSWSWYFGTLQYISRDPIHDK